jgi:serine/threonine protein phosphatase PrpC
MRTLGLLVALALLGVGLYRLYEELRLARRLAGKPARRPDGGARPAAAAPAAAKPAAAAPATAAPAAAKPAAAKPAAAPPAAKPAAAPPAAAKAEPAAEAKRDSSPGGKMLPSALTEPDTDEDITIITLTPPPEVVAALNALAAKAGGSSSGPASTRTPAKGGATTAKASAPAGPPPKLELHGDDDEDSQAEAPSAIPIVYDAEASVDEPTRISPLILVSAAAQTDQGRRRRRNEDSLLVLEDHHLFVVADGMGGHAGGDVASKMAVEAIGNAFTRAAFAGDPYPDVPRRGAELALAIQMANKAIYDHAKANAAYQGMGTTVVSARFSPNKQRVYFGHVGDSRCYRLRGKQLTQITTDHTMAAQGVTGPLASHLNRAVGVNPAVKVDLIIARPSPDDVYLLCTDGLSKMVPDDQIQAIMNEEGDLEKVVHNLVERANARGGRDNITVILVQVKDPKGLAKYIRERGAAAAAS